MNKNNDVVIKLEHINKKFGEKEALKDVTFNVKRGEILGFLGPSGAGKTTLIKILTGQKMCIRDSLYVDNLYVYKLSKRIKKTKLIYISILFWRL